ncbi:uncharacterized protein [Onthophagus taurus]|uniref:uncharacterized protein n=1 Tax=Onthophagus taurus TaxID=166361 RepID=UPI000C2080DE|nr:dihydroceramide fatty acyl 2-hydroxylase FAH2 [Onthophagus taurus]XP_022905800.1 dihydroceramide fatty acyl 2-hydroxylase FAH2 [Onthophagus taurus]
MNGIKKDDSFNVKYTGKTYDIQDFLKNHPGGSNYVDAFRDKDVTQKMLDNHHSKAAFYLLREYKLGGRDEIKNEHTEDLEDIVDWNKPMFGQVASLGEKYYEWVNSPVDRKMRLFGHPVLETLTITPWYLVPIIWIPVAFVFIYLGTIKNAQTYTEIIKFSPICGLSVFFGIVLWTLAEYSLHRWVFHIVPSGKSKMMIIVHFTIHGLHHKVPFDSRRLVFPPFPAGLIAAVLYYLYSSILPQNLFEIIGGGTLLGYVGYDMIHFYIHHGNPNVGSYLYVMKRYHNQHHFSEHESGFGISSQSWDVVFGTLIKLKKLAMGIRWTTNCTRNKIK